MKNQPTDRDGNAVQHGTRDRINRLRERAKAVAWTTTGERNLRDIFLGMLDLLDDEL